MTRTRAILAGPFASSPFANGLRLLLAGSGEFEIVEAADHAAVDELVVDDRAVVVVGEGIDLGWALDLLDRAPNVSVVQLDDAGRRMVMAVDDPGAERLVRLLEELAVVDQGDAGPRTVARLHLVDPGREGDLGGGGLTPDGDTTEDDRSTSDTDLTAAYDFDSAALDLGSVAEWLRLVLGVRLLERAEGAGEPTFAGWTASPADALAGLGIQDSSVGELRAQRDEADRALLVERRGLPDVLGASARTFELSDSELRALLLALAPELDGRFGVAIGVLHDDLNRRRPSITLLDDLDDPGDERIGAWRWRQELDAPGSLLDRRLLVPDRRDPAIPVIEAGLLPRPALVAALFSTTIDTAVRATGARYLASGRGRAGPATGAEQRAARQLETATRGPRHTSLVRIAEPDVGGGWFERVATLAGLCLVNGDLTAIAGERAVDEAVADWLALAALVGAGLQLRGIGDLTAADHRRLDEVFRSFDGTVVALVCDAPCPAIERDRPVVVLHRPVVGVDERIELWSTAVDSIERDLDPVDAAALAATLPLDPSEIVDVVARWDAQPHDEDGDEPVAQQLRRVALDRGRDALPPAVRSVVTRFDWDDLVLAEPAKAELRSIATHLTRSASVLDRWGFVDRLTYGRGVSALFSGASGTGKTMAAQILARELGVELLLVDLSKTVSKYLGETEKNVDTAFNVAERRGGLLLFDEADALFGKRSEVKDAHDRHANVEIAYLLQRMEAFEGIAILTTNLKQNIDQAFLRRLRFIVDFPLPDAAEREAIWRRAFPDRAPLADDIDFGYLGRRLQLTGGVIQQVALHAAFAAVDDDAIGMRHVVVATRRELDKLGMFDAGRALEARAGRVGAA